ncbi:hypothetical protein MIMGU_mgv1a002614mg [Erythranthe guttata]|uniref:Methyltransferase domain-containing protein n=1 Tax=Erythranthe guttata TaxID=4155 RepID=A0A022R1K0_ERYGU|nr:hypothetical protein MIMGU_mgv1a002614mg [Erythranthe guttata]
MAEREIQQQNPKELPVPFGNFTSKESWDIYFSSRGGDDFSEWYADWPQLETLLTTHLLFPLSVLANPPPTPPQPAVKAADLNILVPACGDSRLSEHLYDSGFTSITNVDYSKAVISTMLRRNVEARPRMKWRVMDITSMQFPGETFDAVIDKGGWDVLMDPGFGQIHPNLYITKVKELLKVGGKYICFALGESKLLGLLFQKFRFGWKMNLYAVDQEPSSSNLDQQTFMVVAEKDGSTLIYQITPIVDFSNYHGNQARALLEALRRESAFRFLYNGSADDLFYPLEDIWVQGNLSELQPGRRLQLTLGDYGISRLMYKGILLDAQQDSGYFSNQFLVLIIPKVRTLEWVMSSEEGQWVFVREFKVARLLMILLEPRHSYFPMEDIQSDLSPLVKKLAPGHCYVGATSGFNGPIAVDDVIFEKIDDALSRHFQYKDLIIRRLIIRGSVLAEAVLTSKKGKQKIYDSHSSGYRASADMEVCHNYLDSLHHNGIISGLMLISLHLKRSTSSGKMIKTVVIGLGAGLLPMFMKNCLPFCQIEVAALICPTKCFLVEPFLLQAKKWLSKDGLYIVHLVTCYSGVRLPLYSSFKKVFRNVFTLQLQDDANEVIFALNSESPVTEDQLSRACNELATSLKLGNYDWGQRVIDASELIKPVT